MFIKDGEGIPEVSSKGSESVSKDLTLFGVDVGRTYMFVYIVY